MKDMTHITRMPVHIEQMLHEGHVAAHGVGQDCSVCLQATTSTTVAVSFCGHFFCTECVSRVGKRCPVCQRVAPELPVPAAQPTSLRPADIPPALVRSPEPAVEESQFDETNRCIRLLAEYQRTSSPATLTLLRTCRSQLQLLGGDQWDDLAEQIAAYPQFGSLPMSNLIWNIYAMYHQKNNMYSNDVAGVIWSVNCAFLNSFKGLLTEKEYPQCQCSGDFPPHSAYINEKRCSKGYRYTYRRVNGVENNYLLCMLHPSNYLPYISYATVNKLEEEFGFVFFDVVPPFKVFEGTET